jgi:hypothetical protein
MQSFGKKSLFQVDQVENWEEKKITLRWILFIYMFPGVYFSLAAYISKNISTLTTTKLFTSTYAFRYQISSPMICVQLVQMKTEILWQDSIYHNISFKIQNNFKIMDFVERFLISNFDVVHSRFICKICQYFNKWKRIHILQFSSLRNFVKCRVIKSHTTKL